VIAFHSSIFRVLIGSLLTVFCLRSEASAETAAAVGDYPSSQAVLAAPGTNSPDNTGSGSAIPDSTTEPTEKLRGAPKDAEMTPSMESNETVVDPAVKTTANSTGEVNVHQALESIGDTAVDPSDALDSSSEIPEDVCLADAESRDTFKLNIDDQDLWGYVAASELISELDSTQLEARESAAASLVQMRHRAMPALLEAIQAPLSEEFRRRAIDVIRRMMLQPSLVSYVAPNGAEPGGRLGSIPMASVADMLNDIGRQSGNRITADGRIGALLVSPGTWFTQTPLFDALARICLQYRCDVTTTPNGIELVPLQNDGWSFIGSASPGFLGFGQALGLPVRASLFSPTWTLTQVLFVRSTRIVNEWPQWIQPVPVDPNSVRFQFFGATPLVAPTLAQIMNNDVVDQMVDVQTAKDYMLMVDRCRNRFSITIRFRLLARGRLFLG
jgi:hypothetical protein